jgi:hypothetical protein
LVLLIVAASTVHGLAAADSPQKTFAKSWEGKSVVVKQTLFTLVYNERGRLGKTTKGKRDGLTVVTPSAGIYFQFDGRDSEDDIIDPDPQRVFDTVGKTYLRAYSLDIGTYQKVEPVLLARHEPGAELIIRSVRVESDVVRVLFDDAAAAGKGDVATTLTVKWPVPLSSAFTERSLVENLIRRFVDFEPAG